MSSASGDRLAGVTMYNPLCMNLDEAIQELMEVLAQMEGSRHTSQQEAVDNVMNTILKSPAISNWEILNCLSKLLLNPTLTMRVAKLFRPILIDLASRWLLAEAVNSDQSIFAHVESVAGAFSRLIPIHPQLSM